MGSSKTYSASSSGSSPCRHAIAPSSPRSVTTSSDSSGNLTFQSGPPHCEACQTEVRKPNKGALIKKVHGARIDGLALIDAKIRERPFLMCFHSDLDYGLTVLHTQILTMG